jgi:hypothetical protein
MYFVYIAIKNPSMVHRKQAVMNAKSGTESKFATNNYGV